MITLIKRETKGGNPFLIFSSYNTYAGWTRIPQPPNFGTPHEYRQDFLTPLNRSRPEWNVQVIATAPTFDDLRLSHPELFI